MLTKTESTEPGTAPVVVVARRVETDETIMPVGVGDDQPAQPPGTRVSSAGISGQLHGLPFCPIYCNSGPSEKRNVRYFWLSQVVEAMVRRRAT